MIPLLYVDSHSLSTVSLSFLCQCSRKISNLFETLQFPSATYPNGSSPDPAAIAGTTEFETSPPFYPSPWVSGLGDWGASVAKAQALVAQMTLAEKVNLTTGVGYVVLAAGKDESMLIMR